jgi:D-sedoheptulose 7-phosphate isomerase
MMTFPDRKYSSIADYSDAYFAESGRAFASVDRSRLAEAAQLLENAYKSSKAVFACGNGGSASISNHLACDHMKGVQTDTQVRPRVCSLSSNIEVITAIANDIAYADIFVFQLRSLASRGDVLLTISSSGDSENVVRAAQWARDNGVGVVALTGFAGGRTAQLADVNLHVAGDNYGVIEDVHQALMHILAQYLRQIHMNPDMICERKF